jgi:hypothetical protein
MISTRVVYDPRMKELIANMTKVDQIVKDSAWDKTLEISLEMEKSIKDAMPVDSGRAKAGWGHYTPEDLLGTKNPVTKRTRRVKAVGYSGKAQISSSTDAIWEENKGSFSVIQGTNVPYTEYLNSGTSDGRIKGRGHIDQAMERALSRLFTYGEALGQLINGVITTGAAASQQVTYRVRTAAGRITVKV